MKRMRILATSVAFLFLLLLFGCDQNQGGRLVIDVTPDDTYVLVLRHHDGVPVYEGYGDVTLTGLAPGSYRIVSGEEGDRTVDIVAVPATAHLDLTGRNQRLKATGSVEIVWPGGQGNAPSAGEEKLAYVELTWFEASPGRPAQGEFRYLVVNADGTLHREILALVTDDPATGVVIDTDEARAWFAGEVVSDTKNTGDGTHDDGGCSDGTHDDGGCSDGTHDDGGCSDGTHDDGSCSDGTHDDGGCSDGTHDDGGCSGGGGPGGHVSGRGSRVGQIVLVKLHDGGTPATAGDGITWKWFAPETAPAIGENASWPHLCKKTIIGGNLVVHDLLATGEP